jgi:integrase/recombinase XerD
MAQPVHWLFPGRDPEHPIHPVVLHAACRSVCAASGLGKRVTVHTLRHSFVTHLLESGTDIRIIQALLGHRDVNTTARYAQIATSTIRGTPIPFDRLRLETTQPP